MMNALNLSGEHFLPERSKEQLLFAEKPLGFSIIAAVIQLSSVICHFPAL